MRHLPQAKLDKLGARKARHQFTHETAKAHRQRIEAEALAIQQGYEQLPDYMKLVSRSVVEMFVMGMNHSRKIIG